MSNHSGTCSLCEQGVSRRSILEHLEPCLSKKGWLETEDPSIVIHVSPKSDNRYYLILLVRPDATFYDLDNFLKSSVGADEDRSSRFQFKDQMYFSHMNDGFPGMNSPLVSSPIMYEEFTYLLYSQGWFPVILIGKIMGKINRISPREKSIEVIADNNTPEEYHQWPQRPRK